MSADSLAKNTRWLELAIMWLETKTHCGGNSTELLAKLCQELSSEKMSPVFYLMEMEMNSESSQTRLSNSGIASAGGLLTFSTSESPTNVDGYSLSQLLETQVAEEFCLKPKTCVQLLELISEENRQISPQLMELLKTTAKSSISDKTETSGDEVD